MAEDTGPRQLKLNYVPDCDAFVMEVTDIQMRVDIPRKEWSNFLEWLRSGWEAGPYCGLEVLWSPRMHANVLVITVNPQFRGICCLLALPPEGWDDMVSDLERSGQQLSSEYVEPYQRLLAMGLSKREAAQRLECAKNPWASEPIWRGPL